MILGSSIYPGALSAEKDYKAYTLGEILVLAERAGIKNIAINTEITAEDISATNSRTVAEALRNPARYWVDRDTQQVWNRTYHDNLTATGDGS